MGIATDLSALRMNRGLLSRNKTITFGRYLLSRLFDLNTLGLCKELEVKR
jgi:hypothetical protein